MTDRPDLDALADRLEQAADTHAAVATAADSGHYSEWHARRAHDLRTAARILRAVAAAPGPWREVLGCCSDDWDRCFDALADAVGEP